MPGSPSLSRRWAALALPALLLPGLLLAGPAAACTSRPAPAASAPSWRVRDLARESARLRGSAQVISVARHEVFALVPIRPVDPAFRLERFAVTGGHVQRGPVFGVGSLLLAHGFAWVYGSLLSGHRDEFGQPVLYQVSEQTLAVERSWVLTAHRQKFFNGTVAAPGPGRSMWVGFTRQLLRISMASGAITGRERVPAGVFIDDMGTDPGRRHLYVGAEPTRGGATVFAYLARSGRQQAPAQGRSIRFALNGPGLTGVPGGVFALYRTGMAGQVSLLSQPGLRNVPLPSPVFAFFNTATVVYARQVLFLAKLGGGSACISPGGAVRHTTTIGALKEHAELLGADPGAHLVYAVGPRGLIQITPPASCWR